MKHSVNRGLHLGRMRSLDMQSQWYERNLNGKEWNEIVDEYMSPYGGLAFLLRCNCDTKYLNHIPIFCRNMLDFANEMIIEECNQNMIKKNTNVLLEAKGIFYRDWFEKGTVNIHFSRRGQGCFSTSLRMNMISEQIFSNTWE